VDNSATPAGRDYDRLLSEMPAIAEAVNKFNSPEIQHAAFDALMRVRGCGTDSSAPTGAAALTMVPPVSDAGPDEGDSSGYVPEGDGKSQSGAARQQRARKVGGKKSWPIDKQINFRPTDKVSLRDFAKEKQPSSIDQKNAVVMYYMTETLGMSDANVSQVLAGYAACQWKPSSRPDSSLRTTASRHGWINTADTKAITITHAGRSFVEFDLPAQKAASA
jgi:hypothetical protein